MILAYPFLSLVVFIEPVDAWKYLVEEKEIHLTFRGILLPPQWQCKLLFLSYHLISL